MHRNKCDLKEPPYSVIEAGYLLVTARNKWPDGGYLGEAIEKVERAHDEVIAELADDGITAYRMDSHEGLHDLCSAAHAQIAIKAGSKTDVYRAMQGKFAIGMAHRKLSDRLLSYGYRLPNAREFALVQKDRRGDGDGGGR